MILRTYSSGASWRRRLDQCGQAAASRVWTRSSALGQSPVSSQPDRSKADDRAATKSRNPSGSARCSTPVSVSTDPPFRHNLPESTAASRVLETLGAREGLLPEPAQRLARPPLLRLGPVGLPRGVRELLAGLRQLGFQPPDHVFQLPLSRVSGVGGTVSVSHGPFGRNDFLAVKAFPLGTGLSRCGFLGFRSWRGRRRHAVWV